MPGRSTPPHVAPMLATLGSLATLGDDAGWGFEMKWDGVRTVTYITGGTTRLLSRNDIDMSVSYPELRPLGRVLGKRSAVLDGEIVSFDSEGRPSFRQLQKRMHVADAAAAKSLASSEPAVLLIFDLMYLDGESLLRRPYIERRELLESLELAGAAWQTPPAFSGGASEAVTASQEQRLEGVIAKRLSSTYAAGRRSPDWIKIKNVRAQEVVIGGWTAGNGRRAGMIGALLLGVNSQDGLRYVGKVGTGFTAAMLTDLAQDLDHLQSADNPFVAVPRADARNAHWVEPRLVGEVAFTEWTDDGRLRHPTWRGLRPDKSARDVTPET